jgi:hypothetical protein
LKNKLGIKDILLLLYPEYCESFYENPMQINGTVKEN